VVYLVGVRQQHAQSPPALPHHGFRHVEQHALRTTSSLSQRNSGNSPVHTRATARRHPSHWSILACMRERCGRSAILPESHQPSGLPGRNRIRRGE
jgi:hypothetical protein